MYPLETADGKFKDVPLETLVPATLKHILFGLRPRRANQRILIAYKEYA
jgi:hypothetical protein